MPPIQSKNMLKMKTEFEKEHLRIYPRNHRSAKADALIIVALSELWKAHWRFEFDNKPFSPAAVLSNTIFSLERKKAEDQAYSA
jgi:hypothetical protein